MWRRILYRLAPRFGAFKWFRRVFKGHWEYWYIDRPVFGWVWIPTRTCILIGNKPNSQMLYCSQCEDYDQPLLIEEIRKYDRENRAIAEPTVTTNPKRR